MREILVPAVCVGTGCRFRRAYRAGQAVTALGCCISRPSEVLVGLADHSVRCIDIGESQQSMQLAFFPGSTPHSPPSPLCLCRHGRAGGHSEGSRGVGEVLLSPLLRAPCPRRVVSGQCPLGPGHLLPMQDPQWRPGGRSAGRELWSTTVPCTLLVADFSPIRGSSSALLFLWMHCLVLLCYLSLIHTLY